jgi:cell division protein FtsI (penicillin-binding protein 3)
MRRRIVVLAAVLASLALLPLWKLVGVQLRDGSALAAQGQSQRVRSVTLPAQRGSILDRNGVELAISLPRKRVVTNMSVLAQEGVEDRVDLEQFAARLAPLLDVDEQRLADILVESEPDDPWVRLAEAVDVERAARAVDEIERSGIHGAITLEDSTERVHPAGDSALRVIGTLGPEGPGDLAGVEKEYDEVLSGRDGRKVLELGTSGETITGAEHLVEDPVPGSSVQLTLDRTLQHEVERILADGAANAHAQRGIAIVGRPGSGEMLAIASVERDSETGEMVLSSGPLAFSNAYQAGSVFKLVTVASAVESGLVGPDTTFEVPWRLQVDDKLFSDHEEHPTEPMTVTEIVADSSNVGTIKIAQQVGKQGLYDALAGFGFGSATGTGHPAESAGILPAPEDWTNPDLAASAIGTHQAATAVQLWAAYNVIANDGAYVQPRLVDSVVAADGTRTAPPVEPPRQVISASTAAQVSQMLQAVVNEGTGQQWRLPGYSVAAKTGTSRMAAEGKFDASDGYLWEDGVYHYLAAFTGFLPADRPQVSITVILDDITTGLTGSTAAGPIFSDLARLSIRELGIAPSSSDATLDDTALTPGTDQDEDGRVRAAPATGDTDAATQRTAATTTTTTTSSTPSGSGTSPSSRGGG